MRHSVRFFPAIALVVVAASLAGPRALLTAFLISATVLFAFSFSLIGLLWIAPAWAPLGFAWFLRQRALQEDPQFSTLRRWILALSSWSGTDFRDANLGNVNFAGSDFRFARLTRPGNLALASFRGARNLHLTPATETLLVDRRVRELLVTAEGDGISYDHANLEGASLPGANLSGASFRDANLSAANLSGCDLSDADFSRATLIDADLRNATLTGACLHGWNIDTGTRVDGVLADYVYLAAHPDGTRFERRPQGDDCFGAGDFATLFKRVLKTVDLIFRDGVDWDALRLAVENLRIRYAAQSNGREDQVRVQAIENTDDGRLIVRIAVPAWADKDADYRQVIRDYRERIAILETQQARLALDHMVAIDRQTERHAQKLLRIERRHRAELIQAEKCHNRVLEGMLHDQALKQQINHYSLQQNLGESGTMATGDIVHQIGDFSGSIINNQSILTRVKQSLDSLPNADESAKAALKDLVNRLLEALGQLPAEHAADAEAIAEFTSEILHKASISQNPSVLRIAAKNLLDSARALADKADPIVKLIERILSLLGLT